MLARRWILGVTFMVVAAVAAGSVLAWPSGGEGSGGTVRKVAFDMEPANQIANQPNGPLGRHQQCTTVAPGATFQFDIVAFDVSAPGISGYDLTIEIPAGFTATAVDASPMLATAPGSGSVIVSHNLPVVGPSTLTMSATDPGTGYETGDGVLARVTAVAPPASSLGILSITSVVPRDAAGDVMPVDSVWLAATVAVTTPCPGSTYFPEVCGNGIDDDADSTADEPPPWLVPPNDTDCDGFSDAAEQVIGTGPDSRCHPMYTGWPNWPPTFDSNILVNVSDVLALKPVFGSQQGDGVYVARKDIAPDPPDGRINVTDILMLKPFFGADCIG